jgi:hypothetical protein
MKKVLTPPKSHDIFNLSISTLDAFCRIRSIAPETPAAGPALPGFLVRDNPQAKRIE